MPSLSALPDEILAMIVEAHYDRARTRTIPIGAASTHTLHAPIHTSRRLRRLALLPFLTSHGISRDSLDARHVRLSVHDIWLLAPIGAALPPETALRTLTIRSTTARDGTVRRLAEVLRAVGRRVEQLVLEDTFLRPIPAPHFADLVLAFAGAQPSAAAAGVFVLSAGGAIRVSRPSFLRSLWWAEFADHTRVVRDIGCPRASALAIRWTGGSAVDGIGDGEGDEFVCIHASDFYAHMTDEEIRDRLKAGKRRWF